MANEKRWSAKENLRKAKSELNSSLEFFLMLKEYLEELVDKLDRSTHKTGRYVPLKSKQRKQYKKYCTAIDDLDQVIGHITEADEDANRVSL